MSRPELSTRFTARAFRLLRLTASDFAAAAGLERAHVDQYLRDPAATPYPVRITLGVELEKRAIDDDQRDVGRALQRAAVDDLRTYATRVGAEIAHAAPADRVQALEALLADPLVRHPGLPPFSAPQLAAACGFDLMEAWAMMTPERSGDVRRDRERFDRYERSALLEAWHAAAYRRTQPAAVAPAPIVGRCLTILRGGIVRPIYGRRRRRR